jgi:hypothetical protein
MLMKEQGVYIWYTIAKKCSREYTYIVHETCWEQLESQFVV